MSCPWLRGEMRIGNVCVVIVGLICASFFVERLQAQSTDLDTLRQASVAPYVGLASFGPYLGIQLEGRARLVRPAVFVEGRALFGKGDLFLAGAGVLTGEARGPIRPLLGSFLGVAIDEVASPLATMSFGIRFRFDEVRLLLATRLYCVLQHGDFMTSPGMIVGWESVF